MDDRVFPLDFGGGVVGVYTSWDPDLTLNPQYAHLADRLPIERAGLVWRHPIPDRPGQLCESGLLFDIPELRGVHGPARPLWQVEQWDPLTLAPSILCARDKGGCGAHGYIREGLWVPA
jgi:hypothetical protein